jgi:hypothetical protein
MNNTSDYDMSIHHNPNAAVWAEFFMETLKENPDLEIDEGLMISWFANAMMAMHDHIYSKLEREGILDEV